MASELNVTFHFFRYTTISISHVFGHNFLKIIFSKFLQNAFRKFAKMTFSACLFIVLIDKFNSPWSKV